MQTVEKRPRLGQGFDPPAVRRCVAGKSAPNSHDEETSPSPAALQADLDVFVEDYNRHRAHHSYRTTGRRPIELFETRTAEILHWLESEVWPNVPEKFRGKPHDSRADDEIVGYGPDGLPE